MWPRLLDSADIGPGERRGKRGLGVTLDEEPFTNEGKQSGPLIQAPLNTHRNMVFLIYFY
jgi:hypothetical protein